MAVEHDGTPNRATVALVDAKVDGIRMLLESEFRNVKEQIKEMSGIPEDVAELKVQNANQEQRLQVLEKRAEADRHNRQAAWRWGVGVLVTVILGLGGWAVLLISTGVHG